MYCFCVAAAEDSAQILRGNGTHWEKNAESLFVIRLRRRRDHMSSAGGQWQWQWGEEATLYFIATGVVVVVIFVRWQPWPVSRSDGRIFLSPLCSPINHRPAGRAEKEKE